MVLCQLKSKELAGGVVDGNSVVEFANGRNQECFLYRYVEDRGLVDIYVWAGQFYNGEWAGVAALLTFCFVSNCSSK
jgi:hypothetical protein